MSEVPNNDREKLLTAYLDGELGNKERAHVESLIESNPDDARLVAQMREHGDLIRSMPKYRLDEGFADRVFAAAEMGGFEGWSTVSRNQAEASTRIELGSDTGTDWRVGAVAIATLAAMLLLTLFVFPSNVDQPLVAENINSNEVVENSDGLDTRNNINSDTTDPKTEHPDRSVGNSDEGPSKLPLNKTLGGQNDRLTSGSRSLVPPLEIPEHFVSLEQVLWVDMKSHSTALADIEAVLLKNSMTISRAAGAQEKTGSSGIQGSQNRLVQRSNSGFEALYVIATRSQVKKAIVELSNQHQAKLQAITLPASQGLFQPAFDSDQSSGRSGDAGPNGNVPHLTRMTGLPKSVKRMSGPATVQQLLPFDLMSDQSNPSATIGDSVLAPDATELRNLHEWFGLAETENETSLVRLLLLVDTSSRESDRTENSPSDD